jgi:hypothetical protein
MKQFLAMRPSGVTPRPKAWKSDATRRRSATVIAGLP